MLNMIAVRGRFPLSSATLNTSSPHLLVSFQFLKSHPKDWSLTQPNCIDSGPRPPSGLRSYHESLT